MPREGLPIRCGKRPDLMQENGGNTLRTLDQMLEFNRRFVETKMYEPYATTRFPDKKMVIVTCMDTRLTELLPKAMNLKNGDAKIIKNAGAIITAPFGTSCGACWWRYTN